MALMILGGGLSCSQSVATKPSVQVPWGGENSGASHGPAHWVYLPPNPSGLLGRFQINATQDLYFGRRGERWLVDQEQQSVLAAGDLAEQDLVSVTRNQSGGWLFVGAEGTLFEADSPLGTFQRTFMIPELVAHVEASTQGLLAVTRHGSLLRSSDGGETFQKILLDAPFIGDVRLLENGHGLLLAFPERLYETSDGGLQWRAIDTPTLGAFRLSRFDEDHLLIEGVTNSLLWKKDGSLKPTKAQPSTSAFQLPGTLPSGPNASLALSGMSFWRRDVVLQALPPMKRGLPWRLGSSRVGTRLEETPLEGTEDCHRLAIHGNDWNLFVVCSIAQKSSSLASIRLMKYGDSIDKLEILNGTLEGSLGEARIAVGQGGQVLLWGACRTGGSRASCDTETPLLLPQWPLPLEPPAEGAPSPWLTAVIPGQSGFPIAAAFGAKGRVYLIARRGKTKELGLFLSKDGARTFEGRDLELAGTLEESERRRLSGIRFATISVADEGTVTTAFEGNTGSWVVVTNEEGRVLSVVSLPGSSSTRIGVAGRRVLKIEESHAAESLDGGASWTDLGEVPSLQCSEREGCDRAISCSPSGCLIGDRVGRLGWGGQTERHHSFTVPTSVQNSTIAHPPPVVCRLSSDPWIPLPRSSSLPSVYQADRGKTPWATTAFTPQDGRVLSVQSPGSGANKLEIQTVFPPVKDPSRVAMSVSPNQIEGVAAVRFELGATSPLDVKRVEVAWTNLFEGKLSRGTLPTPKQQISSSFVAPGSVLQASLPLLSISNKGVFVRLDRTPYAKLFFLDHQGKLDQQSIPPFPSGYLLDDKLQMRLEAVRIDSNSVLLGYQDSLVARLLDRGNLAPILLFPPSKSEFSSTNNISFSYLNGTPHLIHFGRSSQFPTIVSSFPFQASGPLLGPRSTAPSQNLLLKKFRPCSSQDRSSSLRIVAPSEHETRRGILIEGADGIPFTSMISEGMILYGTSDSPCASVMEGTSVQENLYRSERALVFFGDPARSWFFRTGTGDTVEARSMNCKITPGAVVPPEIQNALDDSQRSSLQTLPVRRNKPSPILKNKPRPLRIP